MAKIKKFKPNSRTQHTTVGALTVSTIYTTLRFALAQRKNNPGFRVTAIDQTEPSTGRSKMAAVDYLNAAGVVIRQTFLPMSRRCFLISW